MWRDFRKPEPWLGSLMLVLGAFLVAGVWERAQFLPLIIGWLVMWTGFCLLLWRKLQWGVLLLAGLLARIILCVQEPNLSNDYYRYFWDSQLVQEGIDPYATVPDEYMGLAVDMERYRQGMGELSSSHHTVYPIVGQAWLLLSSPWETAATNILWSRMWLIVVDLMALWLLLRWKGRSSSWPWMFFLNPLLMVEGVGNLHYEPLVALMLIMATFFLARKKDLWGGIGLGTAISLKVMPVVALPFLFSKSKRRYPFSAGLILILVIGFALPWLFSDQVQMWETMRVFADTFEFNALPYYMARDLVELFIGHNPVAWLGPLFKVLCLVLIAWMWWRRRENESTVYWAYLVFILLGTVIHPWYLIPVIALGAVVERWSIWVWSFSVFLSYEAYSHDVVVENYAMLIIEFALLAVAVSLEYLQLRGKVLQQGVLIPSSRSPRDSAPSD